MAKRLQYTKLCMLCSVILLQELQKIHTKRAAIFAKDKQPSSQRMLAAPALESEAEAELGADDDEMQYPAAHMHRRGNGAFIGGDYSEPLLHVNPANHVT